MSILRYLFFPNPLQATYGSSFVIGLFALCGALLVLSIVIRVWRRSTSDTVAKRLSAGWASAALWFGVIGLVLVVARVEGIQIVAMRLWWVLWALALVVYVIAKVRIFRARHYHVVPSVAQPDLRDAYLPGKKKR